MQQTWQNPRATIIQNHAEEQDALEQVLKEMPPKQTITFDILIEIYKKCNSVREEPEFMEALFNKSQIYEEFVLWIVNPLKIIERRKSSGQFVPQGDWQRSYPTTCVQITKDNNLFLIHLYLKSYFNEDALRCWFNFLFQPHLETFQTSLGYIVQILMPFIKYDFSDCTKIYEELFESSDEEFLVSSSYIQREETPVSKEREMISSKKKQSFLEKQISVLTLFSDDLLAFIMEHICHEQVFKFLHNLILVSLEEADLKRSKKIFETFLCKALGVERGSSDQQYQGLKIQDFQKRGNMDICSEYVLEILKEIYENANTNKNYRVIFFIDSVVRINVINLFIQRIYESPLMVKDNPQEKLSASADFTSIMGQQEILQQYIKSLTYLIKIFSKMSRAKRTEEQKIRDSKFYTEEQNNFNKDTEEEVSGESKVMKEFTSQLNEIFLKLPELCQIVKKTQYRVIPFSSGQNVKPITMCKYEFFELLYNCLLLSKEFPELYVLDTQKINIFSIIERYLQQNRWNNLAHKVLQKIACLLIMNNKNFFRTKQMNKNNMADEFLNTIIQSFTNKKYIFLNSFRFTSQGNLHALYTIAKAIISKMKESHNLANFVHELDYYKKFVMEDLQSYQKRIKQIQFPADEEDLKISDNKSSDENDQIKLYVDELSVSQIVKKIEVVNKWPMKESKRKHGSFIHRSLSTMSDQKHQATSTITQKKRAKPLPPSQQLLNTDDDSQNEESNMCRMVQTASPRGNIHSHVENPSNSFDGGLSFMKQQYKRIESHIQEFRKSQQGKGLFGLGMIQQTKQLQNNEPLSPEAKKSSGKSNRHNDISVGVTPWQKVESCKNVEGDEEFDLGSHNGDQVGQIQIHVISSDKKMVKNVSIEEKNLLQEQEDNID